jgi:hypothetical protein
VQNGMRKALVGLAANFPNTPGADLRAHLAALKANGPKPAPEDDYVKKQVGNYFMGS